MWNATPLGNMLGVDVRPHGKASVVTIRWLGITYMWDVFAS